MRRVPQKEIEMKKTNRKLSLKSSTVRILTSAEVAGVRGAAGPSTGASACADCGVTSKTCDTGSALCD